MLFSHTRANFFMFFFAKMFKPGDTRGLERCAIAVGTGTSIAVGTDTVLITKLLGLKVRHFNNSCLLIAFTRSIHALFSM